MSLLELCLVALLTPQEPTPPPTLPEPTASKPLPADPVADAAALAAAETATGPLDTTLLVRLAIEAEPATAARAAWVLTKGKDAIQVAPLQRIVADSPHPEARVQALQGLHKHHDFSSTPVAVRALEDGDRRVRTLAAELLGKLRRPMAIEPLLALLDRTRTSNEPGQATDVQAALLALHDLDAADQLLRAATAIHDGRATGAAEALTYCLQGLESKLSTDARRNLLLAVLDHREPLVRRHAITRLAELGDATAAAALERRLATEGDELRPLVEVALAQLRSDQLPPDDEMQRAQQNLQGLTSKAVAFWNQRGLPEQIGIGSIPVLLLLGLIWLWRRPAPPTLDGDAAAALVQPSAEHAEQLAAEAEAQAAAEEEAAAAAQAEAEQQATTSEPMDEIADETTETADDADLATAGGGGRR